MELISQHTKAIMEGCKERARDAGLQFQDESLEYVVTNRDLLELSPKMMIPTLYDYWVHDVEVLREKGKYELYPHNPYETVINTRPAISFYNDNNPDWLNVMIFYHVLAHIDFFQNNLFFRNTWDYDFAGQALSDKRVIARLRAEKGRTVDYVIEFARGIDNLVGYHGDLARRDDPTDPRGPKPLDYYFDVFLQSVRQVKTTEYVAEIERYNACIREHGEMGEQTFFAEAKRKYPEFDAIYAKSREEKSANGIDLVQFLLHHSQHLNRDEHKWMKTVVEVVRNTSLFFQPQIRTKIMNEGWASYWHEALFLQDDRIRGHEVDFARINAWVTALPRVGLNPYALGMRLFEHLEDMADRGTYSVAFLRLLDAEARERFDAETGKGRDYVFHVREHLSDFMFIKHFVDQDFVTRHKLFVAGKRMNKARKVWEYYVKSRNAGDYRQMVLNSLYHPPHITIDAQKSTDDSLYLVHHFEEKPLVKEYVANTLLGIEYLWGGPIRLETSEVMPATAPKQQGFLFLPSSGPSEEPGEQEIRWQRVVYTMENRRLYRQTL